MCHCSDYYTVIAITVIGSSTITVIPLQSINVYIYIHEYTATVDQTSHMGLEGPVLPGLVAQQYGEIVIY